MIYILSTDVHELSTEDVMDWLYVTDTPFMRINGEYMTDLTYNLEICNEKHPPWFNLNAETGKAVVWYRRWHKREFIDAINITIDGGALFNLRKHLNNELGVLSGFFFNQFKNSIWIDHPQHVHLNKLTILSMAVLEGIKIPDTIVATSKIQIEAFFKKHERLITKPISEVSYFNTHGQSFGMDTKEIDLQFVENLGDDIFFPSLVQELIIKAFDIRIFYLEGSFYAMAILSQRRKNSELDFRNYDYQNPDRQLPFQLPSEIEDKLRNLVVKANLEHCSIDMIKSIEGDYVFLEINPVGQFGMVSIPCNYHLEMKIANFLAQKSNN